MRRKTLGLLLTACLAATAAPLVMAEPTDVTVRVISNEATNPSQRFTSAPLNGQIPGGDLSAGDGWVLEMPGFVVDVVRPADHAYVTAVGGGIPVVGHVMMMCGCPMEPGGLWDADQYEVTMTVTRDGETSEPLPSTMPDGQPFRRSSACIGLQALPGYGARVRPTQRQYRHRPHDIRGSLKDIGQPCSEHGLPGYRTTAPHEPTRVQRWCRTGQRRLTRSHVAQK